MKKMRIKLFWTRRTRIELVVLSILGLCLVYLALKPDEESPMEDLEIILDPEEDLACSGGTFPVTWSQGNTVFVNLSFFGDSDGITCCYSVISRIQQPMHSYTEEADKLYRVEKECHILNDVTIINNTEAVLVNCHWQNDLLYTNVHPLVDVQPFKRKMEKWGDIGCRLHSRTLNDGDELVTKRKVLKTLGNRENSTGLNVTKKDRAMEAGVLPENRSRSEASGRRSSRGRGPSIPYSVVIFGVDSVSQESLQRYMPKTFDLLKKSEVIDLQGFNKVSKYTFPNLMPLLAGMSGPHVDKRCLGGHKWKAMDECPFIWKNFSKSGYLTVMGEDAPHMSAFRNGQKGFVVQPTDLCLRSAFLVSEELNSHSGRLEPTKSDDHFCQGPLSSFDFVKQYSVEVAHALECLPYFGFFWTSKITHDNKHFASLIDRGAFEYLSLVLNQPAFSTTFLFFMSDRGRGFSDTYKTDIDRMKDSLPFMYLLVPDDFKERYPKVFENLKVNQNQLTSHYDIHATLWDILLKRYEDEVYIERENVVSERFPGLSLFRRIPDNRTCKEAGVLGASEKYRPGCLDVTLTDLWLQLTFLSLLMLGVYQLYTYVSLHYRSRSCLLVRPGKWQSIADSPVDFQNEY